MDIEISIGKGVHSIASDNILCCNETGRVIAVFYNDYDLVSLQGELETLRAENERLKTELLCLTHDRDMLKLCADQNEDEVKKMMAERKEYLANKILDASDKKLLDRLLAEREAMMKQANCY